MATWGVMLEWIDDEMSCVVGWVRVVCITNYSYYKVLSITNQSIELMNEFKHAIDMHSIVYKTTDDGLFFSILHPTTSQLLERPTTTTRHGIANKTRHAQLIVL